MSTLFHNFFYYLVRHLTLFVPWFGARPIYEGMELVPKTGAALVLSNHISHFDPPFLMAKFPRYVHFMADKPLLDIPVVGRMMKWGYVFPIDRTKNDRNALRTAMDRLKGGNLVAIFPEKGIRQGATSVLGGAELPIGTASLWRMMDVPVIPMVVIGTDQLYSKKFYPFRARVFVRVGRALPPDRNATKEEMRDRIVAAWTELFEGIKRDHRLLPEELPQSAHQRWGQPEPVPKAAPEIDS